MPDQLIESFISTLLAEDYAALVPIAIAIIINLLFRRKERKEDKERQELERLCIRLQCENKHLRQVVKRLQNKNGGD